jgi:hypothetical protein
MTRAALDGNSPETLAEWLESPQCGLMGDERVQLAASMLRRMIDKDWIYREFIRRGYQQSYAYEFLESANRNESQ